MSQYCIKYKKDGLKGELWVIPSIHYDPIFAKCIYGTIETEGKPDKIAVELPTQLQKNCTKIIPLTLEKGISFVSAIIDTRINPNSSISQNRNIPKVYSKWSDLHNLLLEQHKDVIQNIYPEFSIKDRAEIFDPFLVIHTPASDSLSWQERSNLLAPDHIYHYSLGYYKKEPLDSGGGNIIRPMGGRVWFLPPTEGYEDLSKGIIKGITPFDNERITALEDLSKDLSNRKSPLLYHENLIYHSIKYARKYALICIPDFYEIPIDLVEYAKKENKIILTVYWNTDPTLKGLVEWLSNQNEYLELPRTKNTIAAEVEERKFISTKSIPIIPGDSIVEAVLCAKKEGIPLECIDRDRYPSEFIDRTAYFEKTEKKDGKYYRLAAKVDSSSILINGIEKFYEENIEFFRCQHIKTIDDPRDFHMARKLYKTLENGEKCLVVIGAAHWENILEKLERLEKLVELITRNISTKNEEWCLGMANLKLNKFPIGFDNQYFAFLRDNDKANEFSLEKSFEKFMGKVCETIKPDPRSWEILNYLISHLTFKKNKLTPTLNEIERAISLVFPKKDIQELLNKYKIKRGCPDPLKRIEKVIDYPNGQLITLSDGRSFFSKDKTLIPPPPPPPPPPPNKLITSDEWSENVEKMFQIALRKAKGSRFRFEPKPPRKSLMIRGQIDLKRTLKAIARFPKQKEFYLKTFEKNFKDNFDGHEPVLWFLNPTKESSIWNALELNTYLKERNVIAGEILYNSSSFNNYELAGLLIYVPSLLHHKAKKIASWVFDENNEERVPIHKSELSIGNGKRVGANGKEIMFMHGIKYAKDHLVIVGNNLPKARWQGKAKSFNKKIIFITPLEFNQEKFRQLGMMNMVPLKEVKQ